MEWMPLVVPSESRLPVFFEFYCPCFEEFNLEPRIKRRRNPNFFQKPGVANDESRLIPCSSISLIKVSICFSKFPILISKSWTAALSSSTVTWTSCYLSSPPEFAPELVESAGIPLVAIRVLIATGWSVVSDKW
jgi:hypothetical protein